MRAVDENGFGAKVRDWNHTDLLEHWREAWGEHVNRRLAELHIDVRIDHRSLQAQGIDLEPQHKIGPAAARMAGQGLASERLAEHPAIAWANGEKLLANPALALDAITHGQATFTTRDLAMFVHRHSDGQEQFDRVMAAVKASLELIKLGRDGRGNERFTSRSMLEVEQRLQRGATALAGRAAHGIPAAAHDSAIAAAGMRGLVLGIEQQAALRHVIRSGDLASIIGYAGTGKSAMLGVARDAWEHAGYRVQGAALSGIAAENLEGGSGISSRTIASLEHQWSQGRDQLGSRDVLVIDEAGMIGSRQMERIISEAEKRGTKVVLVGDPEQLQAIEAGAAFRAIAERHGAIEITDIRRQHDDWQRDATRQLATGRADEAIRAYEDHGAVHASATRDQARTDLINRWDEERKAAPGASRIILAHTNDDVHELNQFARARLRDAGDLGEDVIVATARGQREFAAGDRIMFLRNERSLGVKNGSLGRIQSLTAASMAVTLDDGRAVTFDPKDYEHIDHGYAATIHKTQGVTVDRTHVLATPGLDRHAAYVALSRHRDGVSLHYGRDDFADEGTLVRALSRERQKDMASDYVREFADRRAIVLPQSITPARQQEMFGRADLPTRAPPTGRGGEVSLHDAIVRFAKATAVIVNARQLGLSESPAQRAAFDAARHELDAIRPQASRDLRAAFVRDMQLIDDAAAGNSRAAIRALEWERRYRTEPQFRANQFVKAWRQLGDHHEQFERRGNEAAARRIASQMAGLAKSLERDPQVESLLRRRTNELGLPPFIDKPLSQALPDWIGWGRGRGLGR